MRDRKKRKYGVLNTGTDMELGPCPSYTIECWPDLAMFSISDKKSGFIQTQTIVDFRQFFILFPNISSRILFLLEDISTIQSVF